MRKTQQLLTLFTLVLLCACSRPDKPQLSEFRAVWIASVNNIDWPKHKQYEPDSQKQAFIDLLDFYAAHHFNAVIVQIRTAGDALYPTGQAPWSRFLTGKEGKAPEPYYDPVEFMIEECHKRNLEFHAWLNPYRATVNLDTTILSEQHAFYQHPEWIIQYGKRYYLNPGLPPVRQHIVAVIAEVCEKYDIDGVHFDDYFYPYKIKGEEFNDSLSYQKYGQQLYPEPDDWRRQNVNLLVKALHEEINRVKPGIPFGISPFGVWRNVDKDPRGSRTQAIQTNYDDLYADCLTWMEKGWVDYMAPQLYFSMDYEKAAYRELANWWAKEGKATNIPIFPGIGIYKVENNHDSAWYDLEEVPRQIALNQNLRPIEGTITFSAKSLLGKTGLAEQIKSRFFREKRLPYVREQLTEITPAMDSLRWHKDSLIVSFQNTDSLDLESIIVFTETQPNEFSSVLHRYRYSGKRTLVLPLAGERRALAFAYLDRFRRLSLLTPPIVYKK